MNSLDFMKGIGIGMVAGTAIGMTAKTANKKKSTKTVAGKALKAAGEIVENISQALGM